MRSRTLRGSPGLCPVNAGRNACLVVTTDVSRPWQVCLGRQQSPQGDPLPGVTVSPPQGPELYLPLSALPSPERSVAAKFWCHLLTPLVFMYTETEISFRNLFLSLDLGATPCSAW